MRRSIRIPRASVTTRLLWGGVSALALIPAAGSSALVALSLGLAAPAQAQLTGGPGAAPGNASGGGAGGGVDSDYQGIAGEGGGSGGGSYGEGGGGGGPGADGGSGGADFDSFGGAGGSSPGAAGGDGVFDGFGGGGGGGGGAHGFYGSGLPGGGDLAGGAGGDGASTAFGGGGGAGGYGAVLTGGGTSLLAAGRSVFGGAGGAGGDGVGGAGGGGGDGGYGLVATGAGTITIEGALSGGNGGSGGGGGGGGGSLTFGGDGGKGGAGLHVDADGATAINAGSIVGGVGGAGGGGSDGSDGEGGRGVEIVGDDNTLVNDGVISGGLSGDGVTRTDAITFTGDANRLELQDGSTIIGNVVATGAGNTLALGGAAAQYRGFDALEKTGAGAWTLTGVSSYAGPTAILGGTLLVNGTLGGTFEVASGGRLGGSGTVGDTTVASGGVVAPGNSIGTLDVAGGIAFASGSIYEVEVDSAGSASDLIHATGAATLAGGSVIHIGAAGAYRPDSTYTILTADGGVTGFFDGVTSNFAFLDPTLVYDPNNIYLNLVRNEVSFSALGETSNQRHAGEGVESTGAGSPVHDAIVGLAAEEARAAFDQLSGEIHASARGMMLQDSRFLREAATTRVRAAFAGAGGAELPVMAFGPATPQGAGAGAFAPAAADTDRAVMWMRGFGSWGEREGDGNAADFGRSTGGVFIGADAPVGDWRAGLLAGYSRSSFDVDERGSSGQADSYHLGLYGGTQWGALGLRLGGAYSWHDVGTDRAVAFSGLADSLSADYDAATAQAFGELGYRIGREALAFEPFANLAYVNLHTDGFTEDGGAAALAGDSADADAAFTTLGLRASAGFMSGGIEVTARGMLGWRHAFGDVTPHSTHAFAGGDAFTIAGIPIAEDAAVLEAGLDFQVTETATLGLSYSGQIAGGESDHGARATLTVKF